MPLLKAGEFDLDYIDAGAGPPVVLVHSSASGHRQWAALIEMLSGQYRFIAINLFGYGKTSAWPGKRPLSLADQAQLVGAAADLAGEPVALIGHSLGGAVSFEAAARLANRVRTLIAFEPILFNHLRHCGRTEEFAEIENVARRFAELGKAGAWDAAGEWFVDYWTGAGTWAKSPEPRRERMRAMLPPILQEWDMVWSAPARPEDWAIAAPVHLIRATDTRAPTREIVNLLAPAHPDWHVHDIPAGGHMAPVTRPDLVNPLMQSILDGT